MFKPYWIFADSFMLGVTTMQVEKFFGLKPLTMVILSMFLSTYLHIYYGRKT